MVHGVCVPPWGQQPGEPPAGACSAPSSSPCVPTDGSSRARDGFEVFLLPRAQSSTLGGKRLQGGRPRPLSLFWRLWGGFGADTTDRVSCWDLQVPPHVTAGRCCSLQRSRFRVSPPDSCCVTTGRRGAASRPAVGSSVRAPCVTPELPPRGRGARQLPACQHGQP